MKTSQKVILACAFTVFALAAGAMVIGQGTVAAQQASCRCGTECTCDDCACTTCQCDGAPGTACTCTDCQCTDGASATCKCSTCGQDGCARKARGGCAGKAGCGAAR